MPKNESPPQGTVSSETAAGRLRSELLVLTDELLIIQSGGYPDPIEKFAAVTMRLKERARAK